MLYDFDHQMSLAIRAIYQLAFGKNVKMLVSHAGEPEFTTSLTGWEISAFVNSITRHVEGCTPAQIFEARAGLYAAFKKHEVVYHDDFVAE